MLSEGQACNVQFMFWTANVAISRIAFRSLSVEIIDPQQLSHRRNHILCLLFRKLAIIEKRYSTNQL